jgi:hypothetical protein
MVAHRCLTVSELVDDSRTTDFNSLVKAKVFGYQNLDTLEASWYAHIRRKSNQARELIILQSIQRQRHKSPLPSSSSGIPYPVRFQTDQMLGLSP